MNKKSISNKNSQQRLLNETQEDENYFTQYLDGDSQLSELYHSTDTPEPAEQLSQRILLAAKKEAEKTTWWTRPGSWAATIAIVSLAGLLTLNTWQAEQERVQQTPFEEKIQQRSLPTLRHKENQESQSKAALEPNSRTINIIRGDENNDSRKLNFKSAPAPVLQSVPGNLLSEQTGSAFTENDFDAIQSLSKQPVLKPKTSNQEFKSDNEFSDEQQKLAKIKQLIENNQLGEARKLLSQFREKHPKYPIDPVILQRLTPY